MRRPLTATLTALALVLTSALAWASPAQAHGSAYYASGLWPDNQEIGFGVDIGYPLGYWRYNVSDGAGSWRGWTASNIPKAYWTEPDDVEWGSFGTFESGCKLRGKINVGGIYMQNLDSVSTETIAQTRWCNISGVRKTFQITIDSTRDFYVGSGTPGPNQTDLWSAAAHEFGHALGQNIHFTNGDVPCPANDTKDTMCASMYNGSTNFRTLGTHDKHTIDNVY